MKIMAIDPGPLQSAYVRLHDGIVAWHGILPNEHMRALLWCLRDTFASDGDRELLAIERMASMGMAIGQEVLDTCVETGRFVECGGRDDVILVKRHEVKSAICGDSRAKDTNIRRALMDRFGGDSSIGTKKKPGPLYGIASHEWAALAVAVTVLDRMRVAPAQRAA